uniref:Thioredoxin domain-containing protein n=1 Tax=Trieres chinensis TaxID=1514140 RepID=A0A7S2E6Q8_TRICV|mmetsp:Transcript_1016/g.2097  ORF Transcript_1016/g.2097 Transcript_1016/m.2097 type:complete len:478 (+) Transcript_1016:161-1594(+)
MQGNINSGGGRGRQAMSNIDFYRRVPKDLTEATTLGAIMSLVAMATMSVLFFSETWAFARTTLETAIAVDDNAEPQIRLNFNITLHALHCDFVSVDVWDALGTNRQNVTKNVEKWQLDGEGVRRIFSGRNREAREVKHEEHEETLEELHEDGVHATMLTSETFQKFLDDNEMAFVDLYAPWCIWCQRLMPTWEKFAEAVEEEKMPVGVGAVDCVTEAMLCREQRVMAFPTLRWYQGGVAQSPDYKMDRTVAALTGYARRKLETNERYKDWEKKKAEDPNKAGRAPPQYNRAEYPGCQVSGHLMVNRVPGNFHIEAKAKDHSIDPTATNLTLVVHSLSFGTAITNIREQKRVDSIIAQLPKEHRRFDAFNGKTFVTTEAHQAHHHHIKVIPTSVDMGSGETVTAYQMLGQSQVVFYDAVNVPEARFSYDLSPMTVTVTKEGRKWYDYVTSLCAIVGGAYTTLGLIDAVLYKVLKPKKL